MKLLVKLDEHSI